MVWYSDRHPSSQYVSIFSSEIEFIASLADEWGEIETGGELYGLWSHAGRPVVMLATPPGPKAIHEVAHFCQDVERFREVTEELNRSFALQFIGDYHSHHSLGLEKPSPGDTTHIAAVAAKNHLSRLVQFIVTFKEEAPHRQRFTEKDLLDEGSSANCPTGPQLLRMNRGPRTWCQRLWPFPRRASWRHVVVNSFFYANASSGQWTRCPLKIIPGLSPIRMALLHSGLLKDVVSYYPSDRIAYEQWNLPEDKKPNGSEVPDEVMNQIHGLPEKLLEEMSVTTYEGFFAIHLILPDKSKLSVVYPWEKPYPVRAVFIQNGGGQTAEVTDNALIHGRHTKISEIYQRVVSLTEDNQQPRQHPLESREEPKRGNVIDSGISKKDAEPI